MSRYVNHKIYQLYCVLHGMIEAAVLATMQKAVQIADDDEMIRVIKKHRYGVCSQGTPGKCRWDHGGGGSRMAHAHPERRACRILRTNNAE